jgi:hypothetical protein
MSNNNQSDDDSDASSGSERSDDERGSQQPTTATRRRRGRATRKFTSSDTATQIRAAFKNKKTKPKTKGNYNGKLNQIKEFFVEHYPDALNADGELEAPLEDGPLLHFFSYVFMGAHERLKLNGPEDVSSQMPDPKNSGAHPARPEHHCAWPLNTTYTIHITSHHAALPLALPQHTQHTQ